MSPPHFRPLNVNIMKCSMLQLLKLKLRENTQFFTQSGGRFEIQTHFSCLFAWHSASQDPLESWAEPQIKSIHFLSCIVGQLSPTEVLCIWEPIHVLTSLQWPSLWNANRNTFGAQLQGLQHLPEKHTPPPFYSSEVISLNSKYLSGGFTRQLFTVLWRPPDLLTIGPSRNRPPLGSFWFSQILS